MPQAATTVAQLRTAMVRFMEMEKAERNEQLR